MPISQKLLQSASMYRCTLSFNNERLELFYRQYHLRNLRRQARIALLVGVVLYALYGGLDFLLVPRELLVKVWYIRAVVMTLALAVFALSFNKPFARYSQPLRALVGLAGGLGLVVIMSLLPDFATVYLYAGLILITFWCHSFVGLRFIYAISATLFTLVVFNLTFLWLRHLPTVAILSYDFFIISANLVGGFSSYMAEKQSRMLFLREKELDRERYLQRERALHDNLTGLPNRELLVDRIDQAINYSARNNQVCAGIYLDMDRFKPINDTYGHAIGDLVLQAVAVRLKEVMRETDTLSRLGGDEFFILARDIQSTEAAEKFAIKLQLQLEMPIIFKDSPVIVNLSASIGICIFPDKDDTALSVIQQADQAMYRIKHGAGAGIAFAVRS